MRWRAACCGALLAGGCMPTAEPHAPRLGRGDTGLIVRADDAAELDCEREILGIVDVSADRSARNGDVLEQLRRRARALGGDRVVDVEYHLGSSDEMSRLSGMAARCSQLLSGRDYVVIQSISASAKPGEHGAAYAEIAERARALHAQLIVDVDYEQGDAAGELRITGKAARYVPQWWGLSTDQRLPGDRGGPIPRARRPRPHAPKGPIECPSGPTGGGKGRAAPSDKPGVPQVDNCRLRF